MQLVQHDTDLWSAECVIPWQGGLVPIPVRMTVIRIGGRELILHSPIPLTAALRQELDGLGRVAFVAVPEAHGRFAEQAARTYPNARLLAAPKPPARRKSLSFGGSIDDQSPAAWAGHVETLLIRGFRLNEVALFHRPTGTLVIPDLCFNVQRSDSLAARLFFKANGMWQRFGPSRLIRALTVSDRLAFERSLERMFEWDFERVIPGHGDVLERGGPAAIRRAWLGR